MTRKATTFRLDPAVQAGLALLSEVLSRPQNQLVNEAVRELVARRAQEVMVDLAATLERLKAFQASDPTGEKSMEAAMRAEAAVEQDPAQGAPAARPASMTTTSQ
jgi:predicted transcriptional regulator